MQERAERWQAVWQHKTMTEQREEECWPTTLHSVSSLSCGISTSAVARERVDLCVCKSL